MSDPCQGCAKFCCGAIPGVRPVIMPWEDANQYATVRVGLLTVLAQDDDGVCVYFDYHRWNTGRGGCLIYNLRPFECRLYPLILDFSGPCITLVHDPRASCNRPVWTPEWVAAYRKAGF